VSHSRIAVVVLFFAALLVAPASAQASSTVLCTGYSSCSGKGYSHAGYSSNQGTSYWNMYTGTNCTNYIAYRLITTNGLPNKRPHPGVGNARDWGTAMASATNSTPAVGAVAWWGKTGNHVAYIEKVVSSSEIWVSESNWSGSFDWRKITKSGVGWPDGIIHFSTPELVNSSPPAIVGTAKVGSAVKVVVGAWSPTPSKYSYQWLIDGAPVSGATQKDFTLTTGHAGKNLTARVVGTHSGFPTVTATSAAVPVAPGTLTVTTGPQLSGTPKVGSRLTTTSGTWSRKDATLSYQWLSAGEPISGATASTYVPRSTDLGRPLTAQVTATRYGYAPTAARTGASAQVGAGTLVRRTAPSVSGTPRVGSRLTAQAGTWSPTATATFQWYADGRAVAGATAQTFVPTQRQRGESIRVRVTARRAGYTSATATSGSTSAVAAGRISLPSAPTVTGTPTVGSKLTISPGTAAPSSASMRYQWLRDGRVLSGATGRSRKVSANDLGHRLSARVVYKATGYSARTATTTASKRVRSAAKLSIGATATAPGTVAFTVRVSASQVASVDGTITVRDATGRTRTVRISRGRAQFTLTGQAVGPQRYRVTFRATSTIGSTSKDKTVTVR
jgi:surface antigen